VRKDLKSGNLPNIILVVLDTLRFDRIKAFEGVLEDFKDYGFAFSASPWTLPSHVTLFTGLYPSQHGSHEDDNVKCDNISRIRNHSITLPERLKDLGYSTYAYSANILVSQAYGFSGFDRFVNFSSSFDWPKLLDMLSGFPKHNFEKYLLSHERKDAAKFLLSLVKDNPQLLLKILHDYALYSLEHISKNWPFDKGSRRLLKMLSHDNFRTPFFLFMNLLEVHEPYFKSDSLVSGLSPRPVETVSSKELHRWIEGYDVQVAYTVKRIQDMLSLLQKRGMLDDSLVIITSDHGQLLGEHGWIGHGVFLYDELIRVPLMVKYPISLDIKFEKPTGVISLASLPRFILELVQGKQTDCGLYGSTAFAESWGLYERVPPKREKIARAVLPTLSKRRVAAYSGSSKLAYNVTDETVEEFATSTLEEDAAVQAYLKSLCVDFMSAERKMSNDVTSDEDDALVLDQLRRLGYV
jgi:arylsulfatase A-like enzyme